MKSNEKSLAIAAVVIAVIAVLLAFAAFKGTNNMGVGTGNPQSAGQAGSAGGVGSSGNGTLPLSYNDAIDLYGDYRFQFTDCHGMPGSMNLAAGVTFMLDNRDNQAHTIKVGTTSYAIGAYGFRVAKSPKAGTYQITCDGGGAATLKVQ